MIDVERARRWLTRRPPTSRAVHEARRRLRRARALLKLGRGTAVERECARAGAACRRAARALAPLRDARVFAETVEGLLARRGEDLPEESLARGRALARRARADEARALARGAALTRARAALRACRGGPEPAAFERAVLPSLEKGLRRSFRRGRRDFRAARSSPRRGRFHDLRKDSKVLLHELEETGPPSGGAAALRRLTKVLGEEHDLSMLRDRLGRLRRARAPEEIARLARRRQRRLRRRALVLAEDIFSGRGRGDAIIGES